MTDRKVKKPASKPEGRLVVPAHGRGRLWQGKAENHVPGTGRPKDEVRAKLAELSLGKGVDFLTQLMDGKVDVRFFGMCPHCKKETPLPEGDAYDKLMDEIGDRVNSSIEHRLKGNEQALKYGVGTKDEIDIREDPRVKAFIEKTMAVVQRNTGTEVYKKIIQELEVVLEQ